MRWIASARRRRPARRRVPASCRTARHASAGPHACLAAHSAVARRSSRQACGRPSTASPMPCAGRAAPPSGWGTRPRIPCRWPAAPDGPRRCVNHSMSHAASHPANCPAHRCASHPGPTQAPSGPSNVSVSPGARRGRMPSVKTPPGMRRMWNSSRTGGRIALDDVRRGTARHRGARRSGARRCGDRSRGDRSQRVRRSGDRHIGDGEVASDAIFQQQLHMLSRQPGVGPRVLHFDDELRHAWRQRQARHHARAAARAAGPAPASAEMSGADRRPRGTGTSAARRRR